MRGAPTGPAAHLGEGGSEQVGRPNAWTGFLEYVAAWAFGLGTAPSRPTTAARQPRSLTGFPHVAAQDATSGEPVLPAAP